MLIYFYLGQINWIFSANPLITFIYTTNSSQKILTTCLHQSLRMEKSYKPHTVHLQYFLFLFLIKNE